MTQSAIDQEEDLRTEIERAIQRNIKGLEYFKSPSPAVGASPRDVIHQRGTLRLSHYRPMVEEVYRVPILFVMAPSNHGYFVDMVSGQSMIEFLLKAGFDVYMQDYIPPRPDEKYLRLNDYVLDFIPDCVSRVLKRSGQSELTIISYCAGGVMGVCYAALHTKGPLKNLVCLTTPVNFHEMKLFSKWADRRYFDVDKFIDTVGNVRGEDFFAASAMLRPVSRAVDQIRLWDNMWNDEYVNAYRRLDKWVTDSLPMPGEYIRQVTKEFLWDNRLFKDELTLSGQPVRLKNITVPFLHAVAEFDHITPRAATKPLIEMVGSEDKQEIVLRGGHISLAAGPNASKRLWPILETWLGERSE